MCEELISHVPALLQKKGWTKKQFVARCMLANLGADVAYRVANGETNLTTRTLAIAAKVLGQKSISSLVDLRNTEAAGA